MLLQSFHEQPGKPCSGLDIPNQHLLEFTQFACFKIAPPPHPNIVDEFNNWKIIFLASIMNFSRSILPSHIQPHFMNAATVSISPFLCVHIKFDTVLNNLSPVNFPPTT